MKTLAMMLCVMLATVVGGMAYGETDWRVVAVDQASRSVIVVDGAPGAKAEVLWRWTPSADKRVKKGDETAFDYIDECKVVDSGATILVNASGSGLAAIDVATTQCVWYAKATRGNDGPHSLTRLPDGRIAVANSSGCDALEIIDVSMAPLDPSRQRRVRASNVPGAHGVVWDSQRNSLFVLGYTNLFEYAYAADRCAVTELNRWQYDKQLGDAWGHDLVPDDKGGYFMTNHSGVWRFDPVRGAFTEVSKLQNVKSFSRDSAKGDLVQIPTEHWWSDHLTVINPGGTKRTIGPFPGARFYKGRWFSADARQGLSERLP